MVKKNILKYPTYITKHDQELIELLLKNSLLCIFNHIFNIHLMPMAAVWEVFFCLATMYEPFFNVAFVTNIWQDR